MSLDSKETSQVGLDAIADIPAESPAESVVDTVERLDSTADKIVEKNLVEVGTREKKLKEASKVETEEITEDELSASEKVGAKIGGSIGKGTKGFIDFSVGQKNEIMAESKTVIGRKNLIISSLLGTIGAIALSRWILKKKAESDGSTKKRSWVSRAIVGSAGFLGVFATSRWILNNYEKVPEQYASIQEKFMGLLGKNKKVEDKNLKVKIKESTNSAGVKDPKIQLYSPTNTFIDEVNKSLVEEPKKFDEWSSDAVEKWEKRKNVA